jgi:hypothetical protein
MRPSPSVVLLLPFAANFAAAFSSATRKQASFLAQHHASLLNRKYSVGLQSSLIPGDDDDNKNKDMDFTKFNPFDYKKNLDNSNSAYNFSANQISLRKTGMQELVNELLNVCDDAAAMQSLLEEQADFLLEPLDDDRAVLDPDSIYRSNMTREERYQAYETSMAERLVTARNPAVKKVLTTLKDFVLSRRG